MHDYQKKRVLTFLDPDRDPLGAGYHITQSKIAIGSGGLFGKGFLKGTQSSLNFLPEKQTDFIFATLAEEFGFVGCFAVLFLYGAVIFMALRIASISHSHFGRLAAGGTILNLVALTDVYMTFFLPTEAAGRIAMGSEVRLILDTAPQFVLPARVTFVADVAQFTPKSVETAVERLKLMFRIKANIDPALLSKNLDQVKTGLPGVAYVRTDPRVDWPANLAVKLPP